MFTAKSLRKFWLVTGLLLVSTLSAWSQDISVQLDGRRLQFDQPPAMIGGRLLVPLRGIFEALQADVVYDAPTRSIQATKGPRVVQLQLGSRTAIIDGRTVFLDVPADTVGGRTMVPLRFVSESLGADVKWDGATKTVLLSSTGEAPSGNNGNGNGNGSTPPPATNGPKIDQVFHNATKPLSPGQTLDVIVYGEPGSQASFEILGSTASINLPEVSSGKYQTRWNIPNGLSVENGVLLATLRKNGRETATEAPRQVTVLAGNGNNTGNQSGWNFSPSSGQTVSDTRPVLSLTFPTAVQPNSVRFFVDGVDFSNQVSVNGRNLRFQPGYDFSAAQHQAEVQATSINGQQIVERWSFNIDPNINGGNNAVFSVQEYRPAPGSQSAPRSQIGAVLNRSLRSVNLYVDGQQIGNQAGLQRTGNGIFWTPTYDLTPGQHRAQVQAVDQNGQTLQQDWNWVVQATSISNFTLSPNRASSGQQVRVRLNGPTGATGSFNVGSVSNLALREMSNGVYEGVYTVSARDTGSANVQAVLNLPNGQVLRANAPTVLTFDNASSGQQLTISNLSNGLAVGPVFNVQGSGEPNSTVTVVAEYSSGNVLGAIIGATRSIRTQGTVRPGGTYDIPLDAGVVRPGQQLRITVTDSLNRSSTVTVTRQ